MHETDIDAALAAASACGQCGTALPADGPSSLFCDERCQLAYSYKLVGHTPSVNEVAGLGWDTREELVRLLRLFRIPEELWAEEFGQPRRPVGPLPSDYDTGGQAPTWPVTLAPTPATPAGLGYNADRAYVDEMYTHARQHNRRRMQQGGHLFVGGPWHGQVVRLEEDYGPDARVIAVPELATLSFDPVGPRSEERRVGTQG